MMNTSRSVSASATQNSKVNSDTTQIKQINLQKSKVATANFTDCMVKWSRCALFALLKEPAITTRGKIESIPSGTQVFAAPHPRAAILATPGMSIWSLPDLTSKDLVACTWLTGRPEVPEIVLISMYADGTLLNPISRELIAAINYCESRRLPLILGVDTNSHSVTWGHPDNNTRGDAFEDFIAGHPLHILNRGSLPTYQTSRAQSVIDVTLASHTIQDLIVNWEVCRENYLSDHKCIQMELTLAQPPPAPVKNWRKTEWP